MTPLFKACKNDNIELVKLLLEHGADKSVNFKNKDNYTPLILACKNDNIELVKLLIEHGADVNCEAKDGTTPLSLVCSMDNIELVKLLLEHGAWKDLDADNLPKDITKNKDIEELVLSYLSKNKKNESIRFRRLYRL